MKASAASCATTLHRDRAAIIGCSSLGGGSRRQNIATVIQTAYDLGGREIHLRRDTPAA